MHCSTGSRAVTLADRDSLHFTQSFIQEVMRMSSIAPITLPHITTKDIVVQGNTIPKGKFVF